MVNKNGSRNELSIRYQFFSVQNCSSLITNHLAEHPAHSFSISKNYKLGET